MSEPYFTPWLGKRYKPGGTLILSESTYDWIGDDGKLYTPQPTHAEVSIDWNIKKFGNNQYFRSMNRALCGTRTPSVMEMEKAWNNFAYTVFVQGSVGFGSGRRPTKALWGDAGPHFLTLLEKIRPAKVIVTGRDMWNRMPECFTQILDDLQAYKLSDGQLVWCLALPHPANRSEGFQWEKIGRRIHMFNATRFPDGAA